MEYSFDDTAIKKQQEHARKKYSMKIFSKYLAPWAIPNENIPLNIIWDAKENIQEITLIKPECLLIKEVFNASYTVENDLEIRFNNFESAGYLSAELVSKEIETLEKNCNIVLELKRNGTVIEKINLFTKILRPKLESIFVPDEIRAIKNGCNFEIENPIRLQYEGIGRIFVQVESSENSELSIEIPTEIQEVLSRFESDFKLCLDELRIKDW